MIRRTCCSAEADEFFKDPRKKCLLVEQRFGFLEEIALVGRAATLCHEEELVRITVDRADFDFCRKVVASVLLFIHRDGRHLAVAKIACLIRVEYAVSDCFFIVAACHHELALFALHDCGACVLTHGQHATCSNACVLQQVECNELVVRACFRVIQNVVQLLQVITAQKVCNVAHCGLSEKCDRLRLHLQESAEWCLHL